MTTPAVTVLKENLPQASLTYLVEEPYRELVEGNPFLDNVIVIQKKQNTKDFFNLIHHIRREKFDVLIDFHGGPRASWLTLFSNAKLKIGYKIINKRFLYDIKIPRSPKKGQIHSVENHVNPVKALGIHVNSIPPLLIPEAAKEEKEKISNFIRENKIEDSRILVLHIGAGNRFRDWGTDNIIALTNLFSKNPEMKIVLIGASEDKERAKEIIRKSKFRIVSAAGKLGLRELKELISRATLFVGPDSGPMHIAASTDTPLVIYFGPTLPAHFSPWKANATIIEKDFDCRTSCRQRECIFEDFRCLQTITPEEVYNACQYFLL